MATTTTATPRNWTHLTGKAIGYGFFAGALAVSYTHIVHLFNDWGLHGWEAYAAPLFIDGFAMLGKLGRSESMSAKTRRIGLIIQSVATVFSLMANVMAGTSLGGQVFGVLVVIGYVTAELFVDALRPAAADRAAEAQAKKAAAIAKGQATRAANKAKAAPKPRKAQTPEQRARAAEARKVRQLAKQIDAPLTDDTRAYI